MNNTNPPDSEQINKPPERLLDTAGMMLRKGRENANLTHATVSEALHLTVHYIKALENDDHSKLPGATFVKGYLRTYARFLKLDVNAVLASYERNRVSAEESSGTRESQYRIQKRHDQTFRWAVVTAVIIFGGVAAGWWFVGKEQVRAGTVTTTQQVPAESQTGRTVDGTTNSTVTGRSSVNQDSAQAGLASAYATPSAAIGVDSFQASQVSGAAGLSSTQTMSLPAAATQTAAALPTIEMTSTIDTAVTNTPALVNANPADVSNMAATEISSGDTGTAVTPPATEVAADNPAAVQSASALSSIPEQNNVALTVTPTADGARQVTLVSVGADVVQLYFKGASWVEIDDGASGRLYNETLNTGDAMTLHGTAPFQVLLGDAAQVELTYNSEPISLAAQIRGDKTARFMLGATDAVSRGNSPGGSP